VKEMNIIAQIINSIINFFRFLFHGPDDNFRGFDNRPKMGPNPFLSSYKDFLITSFRYASREQQEKWLLRFAQITCMGISCIILNSFYSLLLPAVRIIALPIAVVIAWHAAKILASHINRQL